jgi:hypothetical protein
MAIAEKTRTSSADIIGHALRFVQRAGRTRRNAVAIVGGERTAPPWRSTRAPTG